jgi:Ca2+-dependent lipid-binding protein
MLNRLYCKIWYACEFWLEPEERRPFTYIIRDFYHAHPIFILWLVAFISFAFGEYFMSFDAFVLVSLGILLGHLFWGSKYEQGQQENPPYLGKK